MWYVVKMMSNPQKLNLAIQRGFTMIELITVIIIIGIVGAMAAPMFFNNSDFQSRAAADQVRAALKFGQKMAIAQRTSVSVTITAPSASSNCNPVAVPVTCQISNAVSLNQTLQSSVTFDALGKPYYNGTTPLGSTNNTITVGGTIITIEPETGYVH